MFERPNTGLRTITVCIWILTLRFWWRCGPFSFRALCTLFLYQKAHLCNRNPSSRTHSKLLTLMPWVYTAKGFLKVTGEKLLKDNWVLLVCPPERGHTAACHWSIPTLALGCITTSPLGLLMHGALSTIAVNFDFRNSMRTTEPKLQLKRRALQTHTTADPPYVPMDSWPTAFRNTRKICQWEKKSVREMNPDALSLCLHNSMTRLCVSTNLGILLMN